MSLEWLLKQKGQLFTVPLIRELSTVFENGMKEMYEWYTNNINNLRI